MAHGVLAPRFKGWAVLAHRPTASSFFLLPAGLAVISLEVEVREQLLAPPVEIGVGVKFSVDSDSIDGGGVPASATTPTATVRA